MAQDEHYMLTTIGQWYVCKQHTWLQTYPLLEVVEKHATFDDVPWEQPLEALAIEYIKRYGADNVRYGNTDILSERVRLMVNRKN